MVNSLACKYGTEGYWVSTLLTEPHPQTDNTEVDVACRDGDRRCTAKSLAWLSSALPRLVLQLMYPVAFLLAPVPTPIPYPQPSSDVRQQAKQRFRGF